MSENEQSSELTKEGRRRLKAIWRTMIQRCCRESHVEYKHYGGMGIGVCDAWSDGFLEFERWAVENGYDENADRKSCTLDRIDPFGDYTPDNCRWSDMKTQNSNKKINAIHDLSDEFLYRDEAAEFLGISVTRIDEMAKREILPHMTISGQRLYCKTVLEQFASDVAYCREKNSTYHRWTEEEDAMILNPPTDDLDELAEKMGLSNEQIRTRLYRHGTSWKKIVKSKNLVEQ